MRIIINSVIAVAAISLFACGTPAATNEDAGQPDLAVDKAARCASTFGLALTPGFGRLDGTVLAVVPPGHPTCARPNGDHLVLQVLSGGKPYRMVVNVQSDRAMQDVRVRLAEKNAPLVGPAWSDGWHNKQLLDYANALGVHSDAFVPYEMAELVQRLTDRLALDARVSVFATTSGGDSAHLVHRNPGNIDGAIVVDPDTSSPLYLMMAFADQSF